MSQFMRSFTIVALCLVAGNLPAGAAKAATDAPDQPVAQVPPASVQPDARANDTQPNNSQLNNSPPADAPQAVSTEKGAALPDAQKNSADSPPSEPAPQTAHQADAQAASQPESGAESGPEPGAVSGAESGPESAPVPKPEKAATTQDDTQQNTDVCRALPPLCELITSPFGNRRMPGWLSRRGLVMRDHEGIDIRAHMGWPVTAFKAGTVTRAGENGAMGISVDIRQDDGMTARYGHMAKTLVKTGQSVAAGTPIGLVGCTGRTTGAHLHFGLKNAAGKAVDPTAYLHSADEVLRPAPAEIPPVIEAQSCGPVLRGPNGRPMRLGNTLKQLDEYTPPPIPTWKDAP